MLFFLGYVSKRKKFEVLLVYLQVQLSVDPQGLLAVSNGLLPSQLRIVTILTEAGLPKHTVIIFYIYSMYKVVLIASIALITGGILITAFSLFSPLWQIAEQPKQGEIHHHGLWWDCMISDGTLIPLDDPNREANDNSREFKVVIADEKCDNKFDPAVQALLRNVLESTDSKSRELLQHRFLPHHKAVIFFSVFTFVFGIIGLITGACSPCFPPNSLLYVVSIFMTTACSILSDVIFVYGATKQKEQKDGVEIDEMETAQTRLGTACYLHMLASSLFAMALLASIASSYLLITSGEGHEGCCQSKKEYLQQHRWSHESRTVYACSRKSCRPIVVIEDESL